MKKFNKMVIKVQQGDVLDTKYGHRVVVAGKSYGEEKFLTIDVLGNVKSRVNDTQADLLKGYNAKVIGYSIIQKTVDTTLIEVGTRFLVQTKNHGMQLRMLCGGHSYGQDVYFTVDENYKRQSRIHECIECVLDGYEIIGILG